MWGKSLLYCGLVVLAMGCAGSEGYDGMEKEPAMKTRSTTFTGGMEGVSVLIFGKEGNDFIYQNSINSGWSADGKVDARLGIGDYKFLFVKTPGINTFMEPELVAGVTKYEDLKFKLKEDRAHPGYYLPADEIFLPESPEAADKVYTLTGGDTVRGKLTRAVSQIVVNVNRAANDNGVYNPLPYVSPATIMDEIRQVKLEVSGSAETLNVSGSQGSVNTWYEVSTADSVTPDGFAVMEGPMVFPVAAGGSAVIDITVLPVEGSAFPELKTQVTGLVERNRKLVITLWLTATYQLVTIDVKTEPISQEKDGDIGIWE